MAVAGSGFLNKVTEKARLYINEPGASSGFTDANLLDFVRRAVSDVYSDLSRVSDSLPKARYTFTTTDGRFYYELPSTLGKMIALEWVDASCPNTVWSEIKPRNTINLYGEGYSIEGGALRVYPDIQSGLTMRVVYEPTADATIFEAQVGAQAGTAWWTGTADAEEGVIYAPLSGSSAPYVVAGSVDTRKNAYLGYTLRILSVAGESSKSNMQDKTIVAYNADLSLAPAGEPAGVPSFTFSPGFSPKPTASSATISITYEVVPAWAYRMEDIVALKIARIIASMTRDLQRARSLQTEYADAMRSLRLDHANAEQRIGKHFPRSIRRTGRFGRTGV